MRRSGIIEMTPELLRQLLGVDTKYSIRDAFHDSERDTIKFILDGDDMPEVEEGYQIPTVGATIVERKMVFDLPVSLDWPEK